MKKHSYRADFKTEGNWIIPFILGWSKSTVLLGGMPLGIMYTIHITPFFNIGVNNPSPKQDRECNCGCCDYEEIPWRIEPKLTEEQQKAFDEADKYMCSGHEGVNGFYPETIENELVFVFMVTDLKIEIPAEFNGVRTEKEVTRAFSAFEALQDTKLFPETEDELLAESLYMFLFEETEKPNKIIGWFVETVDDKKTIVFNVTDLEVKVPEEYQGIKVEKRLYKSDEPIKEEPKNESE